MEINKKFRCNKGQNQMNLNNQSSIQISGEEKVFLEQIKQTYNLCKQILEIDHQILQYFPAVVPPFEEQFQKLIKVNAIERQKRQQLSFYLTSAFFSTQAIQRQLYLKNRYIQYLSKLRQIPLKIKMTLEMDKIGTKISQSLSLIYNTIQFTDSDNRTQELVKNLANPNQFIRECQNFKFNLSKYQQTNKQYSLKYQKNFLVIQDKDVTKQLFNKREFLIDQNLLRIFQWRYDTCITIFKTFLQKTDKKLTLKYIKFSKNMLEKCLINEYLAMKVYHLCLKNILKKQNWIQNEEQHIYFQLQLKKLFQKLKNKLSEEKIQQINKLLAKLKQRIDREILSNNLQKPNNFFDVTQNLDLNKNHYKKKLNAQSSRRLFHGKKQTTEIKFEEQNNHEFMQNKNINQIKKQKSLMDIVSRNNFFVQPNNQTQKSTITQSLKFRSLKGSQTLRKIKQYQLSLKKQKESPSTIKKLQKKSSTARSSFIASKDNAEKPKQSNKNVPLKSKSAHQVSLLIQKKQPFRRSFFQSFLQTKRKIKMTQKTPSKIYLSIKDKVSKQLMLTANALQLEMGMISQVKYEKPKITFQEVLNDVKSMQQKQHQSQSNFVNQGISEYYIQKIQIDLQYLFIMNNQVLFFKIKKIPQHSQYFSCLVKHSKYDFQFDLKFLEQKLFTFKQIKSIIQSTDLFFQLMQTGIKYFKSQPALNLALKFKNIIQFQKSDQTAFYSNMNCLNQMIQMGAYIQPYIYWYFVEKNKINGKFLEKRKKLEMTDPLKFSINLQFFKKNNYEGCVEQFQAVKNKKGLKQCLKYLSQGRQIICKYLCKQKDQFIIQYIQFNPKYLLKFDANSNRKLIFSNLKIYKKRLKILSEMKIKEDMEKQIINIHNKSNFVRKNKKKKSQTYNQNQSSILQKINMKQIFTNQECNRILINNISKNFIEKRFINRIIHVLNKDESSLIQKSEFSFNNPSKKTIKDPNNFKQQIKTNYGQFYTHQTLKKLLYKTSSFQSNLNQQMQYLIFIIEGPSSTAQDQDQKNQNKKNTKCSIQTTSKVQIAVNPLLQNFKFFLQTIKQNYNDPLIANIKNRKSKKIKINSKFYQLTATIIQKNTYLLLLRDNTNYKSWIMYISQKNMRNFDKLTFKIDSKRSQLNDQSFNQNQLFEPIQININPKGILKSGEQPSKLSQASNKSLKSQLIQPIQEQDYYFAQIYNQQSSKFQLTFLQTPYYNIFALKRYNSQTYFTNLGYKSSSFSTIDNYNKIVFKRIVKYNCKYEDKLKYVYVSASFDRNFKFCRFDIYDSKTQQKFVSFFPLQNIQIQIGIQPHKKNHKHKFKTKEIQQDNFIIFWLQLIKFNMFEINFKQFCLKIQDREYKLYETFGQLTLPSLQASQNISSMETQKQNQYQKSNKILPSYPLNGNRQNSLHPSYKNSGKIQLLKWKQDITLVIFNYQKNIILKSEIEQNPYHIFANIFSQFSFKQTKNFMYQNLFKRIYGKVQRNGIFLQNISISDICYRSINA